MPDFYPDIHHYLESVENSRSVSAKGLEEIIFKVRASTGLSYDVSSSLVKHFFQEVMNGMLRGDIVTLKGLGKFYVSSPKTGNKSTIFPKFEPYHRLVEELNEGDERF